MPGDKLKSPSLPPEFYPEGLLVIKGIRFTPRQVDIIACLISGGTGKSISSLLDIEVKTLEAHKKSIGERIGGGIQEDIIAFVQRSPHYEFLKQHYLTLLHKHEFEKQLKELSKKSSENSPALKVEFSPTYANKSSLLTLLVSHLKLAGIRIVNDEKELEGDFYTLTFLPKNKEDIVEREILILLDKDIKDISPDSIDLREAKTYFASCVEVLKKFYAEKTLEKLSSLTALDFKEIPFIKEKTSSLSLNQKTKKNSFLVLSGLIIFLLTSAFLYYSQTPSSEKKTPVRSELPIPIDDVLLKRPDLMKRIDKQLTSQDGIQTVSLVGVVGMGGVGKTTLARQFGRSQSQSTVWELNAETKESLLNSFRDLAYALAETKEKKEELNFIQNIQNPEEKEKQILSFVKRHLKLKKEWLLIYDNVENFPEIKKYFPQDPLVWGAGKVIITTRDSNLQNAGYIKTENVLHIEELSERESLTLLSKILYGYEPERLTKEQKQEAINFLKNIPPFPLDVLAAGYYIKNSHLTFEEYLKRISSYSEYFEKDQETLINESSHYTKTRYGIITSSLEKIITVNPEFKELLLFISLLDSQNIPKELLESYKSKTVVEQFLRILKKYSFITNKSSFINKEKLPNFSIHRSVQEISLAYLVNDLDFKKEKDLLQKISNTLKNYISGLIDKEDFTKMILLINHYKAFLNHNKLLTPSIKGTIQSELGCMYIYLNYYKKAKEFLEKGLKNINKNYKENYVSATRALTYLGIVYRELREYEKAKDFLEESLLNYRNHSLKDYAGVGRTLEYLGIVYKDLGNHEQAKKLLEESLIIYKQGFPENYVGSGRALAYLGMVYKELADYEKAKILLEQSLKIYKEHFSQNHVGIARALAYLGIIYRGLGNHKKAKSLLEQSLKIYKEHFSQNHVGIARALTYLGIVHKELGNLEKAKSFLEESLKIYKEHVPENHIGATKALVYLGIVYRELENHEMAKNLLEKSFVTCARNYGEDHIVTARVIRNLGQVFLQEDYIEIAENFISKALKAFKQNKHPEYYKALENLAEIYLKKSLQTAEIKQSEQYKEKAKDYLNQALEIVKNHFPKDSPHIVRIQEKINCNN
ncbi:MAG: tetratricopeptide repeat protein [Candidatus Paracaedimonas acanthamoebae]|uniref:Tetratricopeptide repeat protein n=1 Tax=Candidatus Paracaedimonas acanthamoebae TaxID=244581 RepID=A0A8J7PM06_9PROT|nr:tetratricopeptide repeat protein [Candidatus Paracaedimonas acanthamoebae]